MADINVKNLQKEMSSLGIISIDADGNLSPELLKDAVEAVKETNLNFKELLETSKQMAVNAK